MTGWFSLFQLCPGVLPSGDFAVLHVQQQVEMPAIGQCMPPASNVTCSSEQGKMLQLRLRLNRAFSAHVYVT